MMMVISIVSFFFIILGFVMKQAVREHYSYAKAGEAEHMVGTDGAEEYNNVYVLSFDGRHMDFLCGEGEVSLETSSAVEEKMEGCIADLIIEKNCIKKITVKTTEIYGKVLTAGGGMIEIDGYGEFECSENMRIYRTSPGPYEIRNTEEYLLGYENVRFVICEEKIQAAVVDGNPENKVRVLLKTSGYTSNFHESLSIVSQSGMKMSKKTAEGTDETEYGASDEVVITRDDFEDTSGAAEYIKFSAEEGEIGVSSISRNGRVPYYRGDIIISCRDEGLVVLNELPVEEYLYGVVPSEMPADYPEEALMSQSICARSFVYKQMEGSAYAIYGAHVDDSINCQVYKSSDEDLRVNRAVDKTNGMVLYSGEEIVKTYYYAASCGLSAGIDEVWGSSENGCYRFGLVGDGRYEISFENEDVFRTFIDRGEVIYTTDGAVVSEKADVYDSNNEWYRYSVSYNLSDCGDEIISRAISKKADERIKIYNSSGAETDGTDVGKIKEINVVSRGQSGIVLMLEVVCESGRITISGQNLIREILKPGDYEVVLNDGSTRKGMNMLPSAFFYVDVIGSEMVIKGGGYGHGAGMSQTGAGAMAETGKNCKEILSEYFPGAEIRLVYE